MEIKDLIREVMITGYTMSIGTLDSGGIWVAAVTYCFDDDLNLYWISDPNVRHSKAILENNKIAGNITVSGPNEDNLGIQFQGTAGKLDGPHFDLTKNYYSKRGKPEPKETEDILHGRSWYVLKPRKIELIHKKLFGFEKQKIELS